MGNTLWCPFTDKPCMGRQCACAVFNRSVTERDRIDYFCGLANKPATGACTVIDHMTVDEYEEAQS